MSMVLLSAVLQSSWGIHGHTTKSAVEIIDTLLED